MSLRVPPCPGSGDSPAGGEMITGARAIAEILDGYGVTHLFHVPAVLRRTMVELEQHTAIKRLRPHGEASAAYMADGYARASGPLGICAAQVVRRTIWQRVFATPFWPIPRSSP